jgi:anti-sigma factor RsiW
MSDEREAQEPMRDDGVRLGDPRLHDYLDGNLPPDEKARFEAALASDPDLRGRLRELHELDDALGTLPGHAAPRDFTARVVRAARRRRWGAILRLAVPLAAAAGVALAVLSTRRPVAPAPAEDVYIWETDEETYGSLALTDLEDLILKELEGT